MLNPKELHKKFPISFITCDLNSYIFHTISFYDKGSSVPPNHRLDSTNDIKAKYAVILLLNILLVTTLGSIESIEFRITNAYHNTPIHIDFKESNMI